MELEDKIKKLEEQFKGLPKVLIKRALCGDDVNEDISKAMDRLREFQQIKNPMAATPVKEELRGSLYVPPAEELDINSVTKSCIVEGKDPGDSYLKRQGFSSELLKRRPHRYQYSVLWAWREFFSSPRYQYENIHTTYIHTTLFSSQKGFSENTKRKKKKQKKKQN